MKSSRDPPRPTAQIQCNSSWSRSSILYHMTDETLAVGYILKVVGKIQ